MTTPTPDHPPTGPTHRFALVVLGALMLAACGATDSSIGVASLEDGATTTAAAAQEQALTTEEAALAFTQCLRDQGIDAPDPTFDAGGGFQLNLREIFGGGPGTGVGPSDDIRAAMDACSEYTQTFRQGFDQADLTDLQDNLLAFAECMRTEGIDMADPDISGGFSTGGPGGGGRGGFLGDLDLQDPAVNAALETCQTIFGGTGPGGFRIGGGGPGGPPPSDNGGSDN